MHRRAAIRQAITTAVTGLATTGSRVYVGSVYPEDATTLPSLQVMWSAEQRADADDISGAGYAEGRDVQIETVIRASGASYYDTLDQAALEIESAIMADPRLGGLAEWTGLDSSTIEASGEIETPIGVLTLAWRVMYRVPAADPQ